MGTRRAKECVFAPSKCTQGDGVCPCKKEWLQGGADETWYNTLHEIPRDIGDSSARGVRQDAVRAALAAERIRRHRGFDEHPDPR